MYAQRCRTIERSFADSKNNHGYYGDICPYDGEPTETTYQRIVGFITPTSTYSKERKEEFKMRDWLDLDRIKEIG